MDFPQELPSNTSNWPCSCLTITILKKLPNPVLVGEDNNIYNLDKKGKKVKGWKY